MRGARETVAKALALECMRAAREQERGCYVFAFSGPSEVRVGCSGGLNFRFNRGLKVGLLRECVVGVG